MALAPPEMAWESVPGMPMTGAELCAQLTDPARNGGRDLEALLVHVETEPLVLWAWDPGTRLNGEARTTPPLSHQEFVTASENGKTLALRARLDSSAVWATRITAEQSLGPRREHDLDLIARPLQRLERGAEVGEPDVARDHAARVDAL